MFKLFKTLFRKREEPTAPQPLRDEELAFMSCIIKVDASRAGWQRAVLSVLRNCRGARFKMDQNGVVEVSGIGDPNKLLKKLGRSTRVELQWFQFGQCSSNLFLPETKKNPNPVQEKPSNYNTIIPIHHLPHHRRRGGGVYGNGGYDYHYQPPPQLLPPYYPPPYNNPY